jgi:ABC-type uncharacterized transport system substrate-binding protein
VRAFDPVGAGFVESLARPGGNITGFDQFCGLIETTSICNMRGLPPF